MVQGANQVSTQPRHEPSRIEPGTVRAGGDEWLHGSSWILGFFPGRASLIRVGFFVALVTWVPLLVLPALEGTLLSGPTITASRSLGTHTRLLVSIPLFLLAESVFSPRASEVVRAIWQGQIVASRDLPRLTRAWRHAVSLWNSWATEAILAGFAVASMSAGLRVDVATAATTWRTTIEGHLTLAGWWYTLVSLPIFQFLLWRWVWRLLVWTRLLWQISRMELHLLPTHPDRVAGLGPFGLAHADLAPVGGAISALFAASFAEQIMFGGATAREFVVAAAAIVVGTALALIAPLLFFSSRLFEVKQRGLLDYGALGMNYARQFDAKWIRGAAPRDEPLLGTADLQSLADLGNSFAVISSMRLVPIGRSQVLMLLASAAMPMLALGLFEVPLDQLIIGSFRMLVGV